MEYAKRYFDEVQSIARGIDLNLIEKMVQIILKIKEQKGRLFFIGVGGSKEKNISVNLIRALNLAKNVGASILGIIGRDGGYTGQVADACLVIPTQSPDTITPHAEAWQVF